MGSFVITLREGFEAALVVSIILAYLSKTGQLQTHRRSVWIGVALALGVSLLVGGALFASGGELEGTSEALYEGTAMLLAAAVVTWMVFWMRKQAKTIGSHLREQVSASLAVGGGLALAGVAFIGVGREGVETALFLFAATEESNSAVAVIGAVAGLAVAIVLGVLFYRGSLRMNLQRFFTVTSVLLIAFAAWLISGALHEIGEVAESEPLEALAIPLALVYGAAFALLYVRDSVAARRSQAGAAEGEPAPAGREA